MLSSEIINDPSIPAWVTVTLLALGTALSGGGIAAILKARYDRQQGVEANELAADSALAERWEALSKAQIEILLNPLRERLTEVEQTVKRLEGELDASRRKYWTAIPYIRALLALFHRHAPDVTPPPVPAHIAEDI